MLMWFAPARQSVEAPIGRTKWSKPTQAAKKPYLCRRIQFCTNMYHSRPLSLSLVFIFYYFFFFFKEWEMKEDKFTCDREAAVLMTQVDPRSMPQAELTLYSIHGLSNNHRHRERQWTNVDVCIFVHISSFHLGTVSWILDDGHLDPRIFAWSTSISRAHYERHPSFLSFRLSAGKLGRNRKISYLLRKATQMVCSRP